MAKDKHIKKVKPQVKPLAAGGGGEGGNQCIPIR